MLKVKTMQYSLIRYFYVKTARSYLHSSCHNTLVLETDRETTDRQRDNSMTLSGHCNETSTLG